ncbi:Hypp3864 [Branchiostoma lanceolatum]|uniref:Hypp3864 protein n=1 Tax=Branchiostoma lanceolatum TaxID=7740 RepID=A0A8K0A8P2_BRALA|nr:Hypp3864 [Branchiostoma lanceolatum]
MGSLRTTLDPQPPPRTTPSARLHRLRPETSSESLELAVPWASLGAHGLFSRERPLSRRYFSHKKTRSLDDFDSVHMILAKCTITPPWMDHVQADGSLLFIEASTAEQRHRAESKRTASIRPQASTRSQKGKENRPKNNKPEGGSAKLLRRLEKRRNQKNKGQSSKINQKNKEQSSENNQKIKPGKINSQWKKHTVLQEKNAYRFVKHEIITRVVTAASTCFR